MNERAAGRRVVTTGSPADDPGSGPGQRVLVVDDEPSITDLVAAVLRYEGFQVEVAATGRKALQAATAFRPHLVVLDVMLPDLDGFQVQQRLASDGLRVPILFLTARDAPNGPSSWAIRCGSDR